MKRIILSTRFNLVRSALALYWIITTGVTAEENSVLVGGWSSPLKSQYKSYDFGAVDETGKCLDSNDDFCRIAQNTLDIKFKDGPYSMKRKPGVNLISVCNPMSQVVAGTNYDFTLILNNTGDIQHCKTKVYEPLPFGNDIDLKIVDWSCKEKVTATKCSLLKSNWRKKRSLLGGQETIRIDEKDTQKAAQWAVQQINQASNSLFMHSLHKVLSVTRQVINGYRYRISLITAPTVCRNNQQNYGKTLEMCPLSTSLKVKKQKCQVSVIYSLDKYKMEDFTCSAVQNIKQKDENEPLKHLLGGDDHDYRSHKPLFGEDDHDYQAHKILLHNDDHDYRVYGRDMDDNYKHENSLRSLMEKLASQDKQEQLKPRPSQVQQMSILEGNDHNYQSSYSHCMQYIKDFEKFKGTHERVYGNLEEESQRFKIFCENMEKIKKIQEMEMGSAKYGVTQFSDLTEEEFQKHFLGLKPSLNARELPKAKIPTGPVPDNWDWRDHGAVTPVKNQGSCGSCWAFSTTGNVEGQWAIKKHKLLSLSEQELVDCDKVDEGCNGGLPSQAYDAIMGLGGLETEEDYKYMGYDEKCHFNKSDVRVKVTGAVNITKNETEMAAWLYYNGPISIGINAFGMQFYWGGIAHPWKIFCNPKSLDHGVLIVGYGEENNEPYWIVKNSWGPGWGREGYYYVYRGDGTCGLNNMCTSATVV